LASLQNMSTGRWPVTAPASFFGAPGNPDGPGSTYLQYQARCIGGSWNSDDPAGVAAGQYN